MCESGSKNSLGWRDLYLTPDLASQQPLFCRVRAFQRLRLFRNCLFFWMNRVLVQQTFAVVNHRWAPRGCVGLALCQGCSNPPVPNKRGPGTSNTPNPHCPASPLSCAVLSTPPAQCSQARAPIARGKLPAEPLPLTGVWGWKSESLSTDEKGCDKFQCPG